MYVSDLDTKLTYGALAKNDSSAGWAWHVRQMTALQKGRGGGSQAVEGSWMEYCGGSQLYAYLSDSIRISFEKLV